MRRLHLFRGRLAIYLELRDVFVGVHVGEEDIYIYPLPCLVLCWTRKWWWRQMEDA